MTREQIDKLVTKGQFPGQYGIPELIETHISWVILCGDFAYKIKKPLHYSFLDFSTPDKRKYYCEKEIQLNKRLTENIYLDVIPVRENTGYYSITLTEAPTHETIIDYAVRMKRLDRQLQMDVLLRHNKVTGTHITNLAKKIAAFHKRAAIIYNKDCWDLHVKFNDLAEELPYLPAYAGEAGRNWATMINQAIDCSSAFMEDNRKLLTGRLRSGFFRDCHGDLHSRNIFLLPSPEPFDCIEFNDDYRQIDVLNEIAFLCMDLEELGRPDLSRLFLSDYNRFFPTIRSGQEQYLFLYYKAYRANIRAKVNLLGARNAGDDTGKTALLTEAGNYLHLMNSYIDHLNAR
ncbi:hypothetical protein DCC81_11655 [Chitinophaga parva]|uniref:Aminoglycoside phosphotransferase domain-containing protein n=1 Tax=Chitinophaga parva TaxID=2169414 RepID=A0A2T7BF98_9BACT|nr:hypothetical protein [Chitinophaga parva]PUZ24966.1 hypothetical protein DCC81_11655 [Chitinophaga parva]